MTNSERENANVGDVLPIGRFGTLFHVTAKSNGHVWGVVVPSIVASESCAVCGLMRRRDDLNSQCKGPVQIELRKRK